MDAAATKFRIDVAIHDLLMKTAPTPPQPAANMGLSLPEPVFPRFPEKLNDPGPETRPKKRKWATLQSPVNNKNAGRPVEGLALREPGVALAGAIKSSTRLFVGGDLAIGSPTHRLAPRFWGVIVQLVGHLSFSDCWPKASARVLPANLLVYGSRDGESCGCLQFGRFLQTVDVVADDIFRLLQFRACVPVEQLRIHAFSCPPVQLQCKQLGQLLNNRVLKGVVL
jgi:hypothetical protein